MEVIGNKAYLTENEAIVSGFENPFEITSYIDEQLEEAKADLTRATQKESEDQCLSNQERAILPQELSRANMRVELLVGMVARTAVERLIATTR